MRKILLFLVLIFTFVLIKARLQWFGEPGKNHGIEIWYTFNNNNLLEEPTRMEDVDPEGLELWGSFSYIILQTTKKTKRSEPFYNIYYVIGNDFTLEYRKKLVNHVIELWTHIKSPNVTLTREKFKSTSETIPLSRLCIEKKEEVKLTNFKECRQRRLYKLTRTDGINDWINMWQVPVVHENLTGINDFVFECDSKALIFNLFDKKPEKNSEKLAMLITKSKSKIIKKTWSLRKLPPPWILDHFICEYKLSIEEFMITAAQRNTKDTFDMDVKLITFISTVMYAQTLTKESFISNPIDVKACYILLNKKVNEAIIFIGKDTSFEQKQVCLQAGEAYESDTFSEISVIQEHTLCVPFVLPFYEFQTNFQTLSVENVDEIMFLLEKKNE